MSTILGQDDLAAQVQQETSKAKARRFSHPITPAVPTQPLLKPKQELKVKMHKYRRGETRELEPAANTTSRSPMKGVLVQSGERTHTTENDSIPIVVISSLRADYLSEVLGAIQPESQNPNTPSWMLNSKHYVFAHRNINTNFGVRWNNTKAVAQQFGCELHVFEGLGTEEVIMKPKHPIQAYHTKHTWYKMMRYMFHTLNETEVLILEDDAVLAYDGLLMAAALFQEKRNRTDVHSIAMGGHAGQNKANANPDTFLAVRSQFFQAMAYSMNITIFDQLDAAFKGWQKSLETEGGPFSELMQLENAVDRADWTMEITVQQFLPNLTQLAPSVGRMHHIGRRGMGNNGNGAVRDSFPIAWKWWNSSINDSNRTMDDMELSPKIVTDTHGLVCKPVKSFCPGRQREPGYWWGTAQIVDWTCSGKKACEIDFWWGPGNVLDSTITDRLASDLSRIQNKCDGSLARRYSPNCEQALTSFRNAWWTKIRNQLRHHESKYGPNGLERLRLSQDPIDLLKPLVTENWMWAPFKMIKLHNWRRDSHGLLGLFRE